MSVRFTQPCPRCGRRIQVRASLLGCTVACQHCGAEFVAQNGSAQNGSALNVPTLESTASECRQIETDELMARVEQVLERTKSQQPAGS